MHQSSCASRADTDQAVLLEVDASGRAALADVEQEFEGATAIAHPALWRPLNTDEDPIAATTLSPETQCGDDALSLEVTEDGLYVDIDTSTCAWLTLTQESTEPAFQGDILRVWAFRWPMVVAQGEGLIRLSAGDPPRTLWEHRPLLPQERSELYYEEVSLPVHLPTGTPLYWHVANHGQNVWSLIALLRVN